MSLVYRGQAADTGHWNTIQCDAIANWHDLREAEHLDPNDLASSWIRLFAADARRICDDYQVDAETFRSVMISFENRIVHHVENLKYYKSESHSGDVGLQVTINTIEPLVRAITDRSGSLHGIELTLYFPPVKSGEKGHAEKVVFPIYSSRRCIEDSQQETYRQVKLAVAV